MEGHGRSKVFIALVVVSLAISFVSVFDQVWRHWRLGPEWVSLANPHSGLLFLFLILAAIVVLNGSFLILLWGLARQKGRALGGQLVWLFIVGLGIVTYLPTGNAYSALAICLMGPGEHVTYFQRNAAGEDSTLLLNAFVVRGVPIEPEILGFAAYHGSNLVLRRLIDLKLPINTQNFDTRVTALYEAVDNRQYDSARILVDAGANTEIQNARGLKPIDRAILLKDDQMIAILLKH